MTQSEPWQVPEGWRWSRFDGVARVASNLVDPAEYGAWPHVAPNHIESETGRLLPHLTIAADGVTSPKHRFRPGQVLYSKIRPYLAKVVVADFDGLCSADMYPIDTDLEPRFLKWWMLTREFTRQAAGEQARTVLPKINVRSLSALPVPVPPLEEQRRVVELLEDHLSRLDAATSNLDTAERKAKSWAAAFIDNVFQGVDRRVAVEALLREPMRNGHSASASGTGDVRTLTLTSVTKREFTDENTKMTTADRVRVRDLWLRSGDLLVQRSNTAELVGTCALYTGPDDWAIFPDLLIRLRADESKILPQFLAAGLASDRVHRELRGKAKGLAGSMPKIDQGGIGALLVPCPDLDTQRRLLAQVQGVQEGLARLLAAVQVVRRNHATLRRSLLAAAYTGRLTRDGRALAPMGNST